MNFSDVESFFLQSVVNLYAVVNKILIHHIIRNMHYITIESCKTNDEFTNVCLD